MNPDSYSLRVVRAARWCLLGASVGVVFAVLEATLNWCKFGFLAKGDGAIDLMQGFFFGVVCALVGTVAGAVLGFVLRPRSTAPRDERQDR